MSCGFPTAAMAASRATMGSPRQAVLSLHGLIFRDVPTSELHSKTVTTEGQEDVPHGDTRGKQLQEQFHGKRVAKQVPSGPTNPLWCDGRMGIHVVPLQVGVSSTTFSSCSLPPVCGNSENLAAP